jgi:NADH:ubiquinone oxidoreductase subunit D/NADH:ubiquinone oxidoreductase subunit C
LQEKFGASAIEPAPYVGALMKEPKQAAAIAKFVRDELKYDTLSNLTATDYLKDGYIEVVYNFSRLSGEMMTLKARVPRKSGTDVTEPVESLVSVYPGAEFQEREVYDMYGVPFEGHPDLRRILLWEGFHGWPMRKDWKEAYYDGDTKPFENRWPGGKHELLEERVPWADNLNYPDGFNPVGYANDPERDLYATMNTEVVPVPAATYATNGTAVIDGIPMAATAGAGVAELDVDRNGIADFDEIKTDEIIVNMGPQHPSTHGVLRMALKLDGENVTDLKLVLGYLHRNHEKIGERNTWLHNIPFTDRLDYIIGMYNEWGYVHAVEKMMNITPTPRVEYLRIIMGELTRIQSHFWGIGFLLNDLGAFFTPALYFLTERDFAIDLFEAVSGSRLMCNYMRFGGVSRDMTESQIARARELAFERYPRAVDELETLLNDNEIIKSRTIGVGYMSAERSIAYSLTGPCIRAAGVPYDMRRVDPYGYYDRFDFDVPVLYGGDVYDRYRVRVMEMRESIKIVQQALNQLDSETKAGDIQAGKKAYNHRVPAGQHYARVETPKGELGYYLVSEGNQNPYRYHVRSCSFINLNALKEMTVGYKVADAVVILGSLDIVLGEVDR